MNLLNDIYTLLIPNSKTKKKKKTNPIVIYYLLVDKIFNKSYNQL